MSKYLGTLLTVLLIGIETARGTLLSYNASDSGTAPGISSFSVPKFNPALGTLLSVTLEVAGNSQGGFNEVDNESAGTGNATLTIGTNFQFSGPGSLLVLALPSESGSQLLQADGEGGAADFAGTDWFRITGTSSSDTESDTLTAPGDNLTGYIGAGNVTFNWFALINTSSTIFVAPTSSQTGTTTYDFDATVTYNYEAFASVPEPTTMGLLVAGTSLLWWARRRLAA